MNPTTNKSNVSSKLCEDELFDKLYNETIAYYNLTCESARCSTGSKKRWVDLTRIWHIQADDCDECSVLDCALYAIYWGAPMGNIPDELAALSEQVKAVILNQEHIASVLRNELSFQCSFYRTMCSSKSQGICPIKQYSELFNRYRDKRLWYRVIYRQKEAFLSNLETATWREIKAAKDQADVRGFCLAFETAVCFLLPAAEYWTDTQWLDEDFLFSCLQTAFGKDWRRDPFAFDDLMIMLMDKIYYKNPKYLARLLRIQKLPNSVIKHIWPNNTFQQLQALFYTASIRAKTAERKKQNGTARHCAYSYDAVRSSWLYKLLQNRAKSISDVKIKRALFDVGINVA